MRVIAFILTAFLSQAVIAASAANTNVLIIPDGDNRAEAVFFVDECLTRGLTNSISIDALRKWATNTIQLYRSRESKAPKPYSSLLAVDVPESVKSIQTRIPSCRSDQPRPEIQGTEESLKILSKAWGVSEEEAAKRLRTIGPHLDPPKVGFFRSASGTIQAVKIEWYLYGVIVGPESFEPIGRPLPFWYQRKFADGVFLWHGYK